MSGETASGIRLHVEDLAKAYGATIALRRVTLDLRQGEVHALLGENGAGKSTLVKILSGIVTPDRGTLRLDGAAYSPASLMEARRAGISTAFQELSLLPNLTVATNLLLPTLIKGLGGLAVARRNEARAAEILSEFDATDIPVRALVRDLSLAQKQRLEIVRALSHRPRVLILDEPTAALAEPEWLFRLIARLTAAGGVSILYISHRLAEVRRLCQRGTVLRNGESIGTVDLAGTEDGDIFRMMVGSAPEGHQPGQAADHATAAPAIAVRGLTGRTISDVGFTLRQGEILGLAALEGQGQRELMRMLGGVVAPLSGTIEVEGRPLRAATPAAALAAGIGFVPEERKTEGIFLTLGTAANISFPILNRLRQFGLISRRREMQAVRGEAARVELAPRYLDMRIGALSGGNQQKALIARVLLSGARNLVLFDPTRGVDVGTKQVIYGVIRDFTAAGGSVLIYSTELAELVQLVHRCLVLYQGRVMGELSGAAMTEERLVSLATGHGDLARAAA
ncbi:sugar ABC transporter ATP-binding protein [Acidisoma sp. 7E03]